MSYVVGATHVLSGSGQVAIAAPVGLRLALSSIPNYLGRLPGTPVEWIGLGRVSVGNADGYRRPIQLVHELQLEYPLNDLMTVLAYDLVDSAVLTVDELVGRVSSQPWDRNGALLALTQAVVTAGGSGLTTLTGYTVPAGRWLLCTDLRLRVERVTVATAAGVPSANSGVTVAGVAILKTFYVANVLPREGDIVSINSPLLLPAGTVIGCTSFNSDTGGTLRVILTILGTLFDT